MNTTTTTRVMWGLGLAGLIPFVAPVALAWVGHPQWLNAQLTYGACILAFLGALHWGPAMNGSASRPALLLAWGVVPSLIAWVALLLPPAPQATALVGGLLLALLADVNLAQYHRWPAGFIKLRTVLTWVASASLLLGQWMRSV